MLTLHFWTLPYTSAHGHHLAKHNLMFWIALAQCVGGSSSSPTSSYLLLLRNQKHALQLEELWNGSCAFAMQSRFDDVMRNRCYDVMQSTYGKSDHLKSWQAFLCLKDCKSFLQWNVLCSHPYFVSLFLDILISLHLFLFLLGQAWVSHTQHVVYLSNRPSFLPCIYSRTSLIPYILG